MSAEQNAEVPTSKNIHQRMLSCMTELKYIQKDTRVSGQYSAVSHDAVASRVREVLIRFGVYAETTVADVERSREEVPTKGGGSRVIFRTSVQACTTFVNVDAQDDRIRVMSIGTGEDSGDKADGKAVSYATKYALLKALMLATGDDPDHDASVPRMSARDEAAQKHKQLSELDPELAADIGTQIKEGSLDYSEGAIAYSRAIVELTRRGNEMTLDHDEDTGEEASNADA